MKIEELTDRSDGDWFVVKVRVNNDTALMSVGVFVFSLAVLAIQQATGGPLGQPLIFMGVAACLAVFLCSISYGSHAADVVVGVEASWLTIEHPNDRFGEDARIALEGPVKAQVERYTTTFKERDAKGFVRQWGVVLSERQVFKGFERRRDVDQIVDRLNRALATTHDD